MEFYKARSRKSKFSKKQNNHRDSKKSLSFRNSNPSDSNHKDQMYNATCFDCGINCKIPFEPKFNKPVYCSRCFDKNNPKKSRLAKSKNFSNTRLEKHANDSLNLKKSKKEKFQKKQESFYSNGSEKFYASLKEKLFEILGGKTCSSCGFKDERALGFTHIYDMDAFDRIRRGGFASSWGKYISDPELARKELRVLCMNCNQIREPMNKKNGKTNNPKKNRYFPR